MRDIYPICDKHVKIREQKSQMLPQVLSRIVRAQSVARKKKNMLGDNQQIIFVTFTDFVQKHTHLSVLKRPAIKVDGVLSKNNLPDLLRISGFVEGIFYNKLQTSYQSLLSFLVVLHQLLLHQISFLTTIQRTSFNII